MMGFVYVFVLPFERNELFLQFLLKYTRFASDFTILYKPITNTELFTYESLL